MADIGRLKVQCFSGNNYIPIDRCKVTITGRGEFATKRVIILNTDSSGLTEEIEVDAPPLEYSLNENSDKIPYSLYDITVEREGFNPITIRGCQVFPGQVAYQICKLNQNSRRSTRQIIINILPNTLNGDYPPKIPEAEEKPLPPPTSGVVLPQPVVPEFIIVHQGSPNDPSAPNYTVAYKDYIKNVASCEIYSTWPENTIRANVYAIISFTLNRNAPKTTYLKEDLAKAADKMLKFNGIDASFALGYLDDGTVHISARSNRRVNVGAIMSELSGGGNVQNAGSRVVADDIFEVERQVMEKITTGISDDEKVVDEPKLLKLKQVKLKTPKN